VTKQFPVAVIASNADALSRSAKPEALGAFHRAEVERWWPIIKAANIKAE
jgi:hypothetical protein